MTRSVFGKERVPVLAAALGLLVVCGFVAEALLFPERDRPNRAEQLLTAEPWYCEVHDPEGPELVSSSVETFAADGVLHGRTRLEDRQAGRVLLEFRYRGVWEFDDPWLIEAIQEYDYLHVDRSAFSADRLAAIEAEFAEPEISRVHALSSSQLIYAAHQSLYQCHRPVQVAAAR